MEDFVRGPQEHVRAEPSRPPGPPLGGPFPVTPAGAGAVGRTALEPDFGTAAERDLTPSYFSLTPAGQLAAWARARPDLSGAIAWTLIAAGVYLFTSNRERQQLDYFVRLAEAFLDGRIHLTEAPSWLNELIPGEPGRWYVAYPPMPAIILVPFVALFGPELHQQVVSSLVGAVGVGLAWVLFGRFAITMTARAVLTATFGFGTVLWYVAEHGSVWYLAHVVAVTFSLGALILVLDRRWPLLAGLLLGFAALSRLPVGLAAAGLVLLAVGWPHLPEDRMRTLRIAVLFGIGVGIPMLIYGAYNVGRFGDVLETGYDTIPGVLQDPIYEHGILDVAYIPRNFYAMFFRSWNYIDDPPFLQPSWWGLSLILTTPLFLWLARARLRDPRVLASLIAIGLVSIPIITHGNVGISQFGYRFSLDFQPMLFVVLATVFERGMSRLAMVAAGLSIAFCAYAIWAISIGFVGY